MSLDVPAPPARSWIQTTMGRPMASTATQGLDARWLAALIPPDSAELPSPTHSSCADAGREERSRRLARDPAFSRFMLALLAASYWERPGDPVRECRAVTSASALARRWTAPSGRAVTLIQPPGTT